ncbi:lipopolysaccharide biosynthesis protein [Sphingomonas sp. ABOLD]|uniref:O-antigen/teichoic acid export membrane protein n=1 Tax=Sphingomonas trueperi TaxID=53317 RepID=A0A7X6BFJ9_9SPHN|nr:MULTISPECIES: lipopolysaccharide biosynthesis protein [Sphingomonas]NJC00022.1 O-antigen/teichoic acid export membrane protein [Sphingomonas trueperi]RSV32950.1 lipopolysaccharide biosynthesis protein [Sphingomonas sp. ABOLE]RSV37288.1 lipopolysaccharide biosynthesis protein [Sphingomonas sp. ABOLD]
MSTPSLTSNAAITTAALAISSGMNFVALFVWTHLLQPAEFGTFSLVSATALLLSAFAFEWLRLTSARTLFDATQPYEISPARANAMLALYAACCCVVAGAAMLLWACGISALGIPPGVLPVVAAFAFTEMALSLINTISRIRTEAWQYFASMVARSILSLLVGVVLVASFGYGATGAIWGTVTAQAAVVLAGVVLDRFWRTLRPWQARKAELGAALRLGAPLIGSCTLTYGASVVDRFLIAGVLGAAEIGHYMAPADLLQKTLVFVMMAINLTAYPTLVRSYERDGSAAAGRVLQNSFLLQLGLGLPAAIGIAVLAPGIADLLFGEAYRDQASRILPLLGIASLLRCLVTFQLAMVFQIKKRMKLMLVPPAITLVTMVLLAPPAMRLWGVLGMAMAASTAQFVTFAVSLVLSKREMPLAFVTGETLKIAAAAIGMGALLYPLRGLHGALPTLSFIAAGGIAYGALLLAFQFGPACKAAHRVPILRALLARSASRRP